MFYNFLAVTADFIPLAIAVAGIIMSYKQPQKESHFKTTLILLAVGFIGTGILSWTRIHNETLHSAEVDGQRQQITNLQAKFDQAEINHAGEIKYLEGELDVFSQFAPAVVKLAQATEYNTRKQYEQKAMSNKELRELITDLGKRMRDWESRDSQAREQIALKYANMTHQILVQAGSKGQKPDDPEVKQQLSQLREQENLERFQQQRTFENDFKQNILVDAVNARQQLLNRLGAKQEPDMSDPRMHGGLLVFKGMLFGPYPVSTAATYLELFSKKLTP